jgi:hypothetical protein
MLDWSDKQQWSYVASLLLPLSVSITMSSKNQHHTQTVAVPMKRADIAKHMEEPNILVERNVRD